MHFDTICHTTNPTPSDSVTEARAAPGLSLVIALRGSGLKRSTENTSKYESTVQKSPRNPYNRMKNI